MNKEIIIKKYKCPRCTSPGALNVGQQIHKKKLRWYETVSCETCGLQTEADGVGFPPGKIRELLFNRDGTWTVRVENRDKAAGIGVVLRKIFSLDIPAVSAILNSLPIISIPLTEVEACWLARTLSAQGYPAKPEPILGTV